MPALTRLALHLHEHSPAGLVRLPTILAQLPAADSLPHRLQQREQLPESSRDRPRRQPQTLVRQLLQQSVTGTRIKVLVQDHLHPHRNAQLAACDQTGWGGRRHEARQDPASTAGTVSPASDHPTPDPGLDLHHLGVIGPRKRIQGPAAAGTLLLRFGQIRHFLPGFQPLQAASPMSPTPRLLSPRARPDLAPRRILALANPTLASTAVQTAFQLTNPSPQLFIVALEIRFPLDRFPGLGLPVRRRPAQIDVLLLIHPDLNPGWRHRV